MFLKCDVLVRLSVILYFKLRNGVALQMGTYLSGPGAAVVL